MLRIIIGGSAGLRMMIALASLAPPIVSSPRAVEAVNSSMFCRVPGPGRARRDRRDRSRRRQSATRSIGGDDRDRRLRAAGDQVHLGRVAVLGQIHRRHDRRTERGRRQVDAADPPLSRAAGRAPGGRARRSRRTPDRSRSTQLEQVGQPLVGDGVAELARLAQAVGLRVDAGDADELEHGLRSTLIIRSVPMLPVPMIATRSRSRSVYAAMRTRGCCAPSGSAADRPKRSSRNGSSSSGRRPVTIISASARPAVRRQRHALHRVAGRDDTMFVDSASTRSSIGSPSTVIGRIPAHSSSISGVCHGAGTTRARRRRSCRSAAGRGGC